MLRTSIVILGISSLAWSATYYIDYDNGSDAAAGTSEQTAWQHAPGDGNATGNARSVSLQGGDVVLFKGGVVYRGSITVPASGESGNPITYKGDGWGDEPAMIDGSGILATSWTRCTSADQVRGNPHYADIYYADAPAAGYAYSTGTYEDHEFIYPAQDPTPPDPFHSERTDQLRTIPLDDASVYQTDTTLTDPRYFTQSDPDYYEGAYLLVWHSPNVTYPYRIIGFDPATHTITHEQIGGGGIYTDRNAYYAILNHPAHIDVPGEYCHDAVNNRVYLWPRCGEDPSGHDISYSLGGAGIYASGKSHLVIEGLTVQKFVHGIRAIDNCSDVIIRNNLVRSLKSNNWYAVQVAGTDMYVEDNRVENCHRAVGILLGGTNIYVIDNYVYRASRQGIWSMGSHHAVIADNIVEDISGTHANGISVYLENEDILVARNQVYDGNLPMTWHGDSDADLTVNLTMFGNIFEGASHSWEKEMHGTIAVNNTFIGGFFTGASDDGIVNVNNIQAGGGGGDIARDHNIYTDLTWSQAARYGWYMDSTEVDFSAGDWNELYADTMADDYSVLETSVAYNAGTDPTAYLPVDLFPEFDFTRDINGNTFGADGAWDIGATEYTALNIQGRIIERRITGNTLLPNPLSASQLHMIKDIRKLDGTTADRICSGGVYLVRSKGTKVWQRVLVMP